LKTTTVELPYFKGGDMNAQSHHAAALRSVCVVLAAVILCVIIFGSSGSRRVGAQRAVASSDPLQIDVALKLREFQVLDRPAVSPNGKFVVYGVMTRPERRLGDGIDFADPQSGTPKYSHGVNLFITDIATGQSRLVGSEAGNSIRGSWSPDGKQLAFYSDVDGRLRLWVYEVASGRARKVTDTPIHAGLNSGDDPAWTSDGRSVLVPLRENTGTKEVTGPSGMPSPSNRLASAQVSTSGVEVARLKDPAAARGANEARLQRLYGNRSFGLVTIATGAARIIIPPSLQRPRETAQFSPSGRFISYLVYSENPSGSSGLNRDLIICLAEDGSIEHIIKGLAPDSAPNLDGPYRWHPTEDRLFYFKQQHVSSLSRAAEGSWQEQSLVRELGEVDPRIFETTRDGKALILGLREPGEPPITSSLSPGTRRFAVVWLDGRPAKTLALPNNLRGKQLLVADRRTAWQPHLSSVTVVVRNDRSFKSGIVRLDLISGASTPLHSGRFVFQDDRRARPMVAAPADHSFIVGQLEGPDRPPDLYRFGADGKANRVTEIEPRISSLSFGPAELFETQIVGPNGKMLTVHTGVLMPPGTKRGDRVPAVATVYGGNSNALHLDRFGAQYAAGFPLTVLLARGYAVLLLDAPMSMPGPGRRGNPIQDLVNATVPQVLRAAELGYIDLRRVAVTGQSYGGYCTAALLSATPIFAAGVATSGLYDLSGGYNTWTENGQGRMGTHPWDDLPRYLENSPYYRANRIKSPLLIVHGDADSNVNDALKMFNALRRLDQTAQLAIYPGQGHTLRYWSLNHAIDATERIVSFLDYYVKERKESPTP